MLEEGVRGLGARNVSPAHEDVSPEDLPSYGVDWQVMQDPILMAQHRLNNPQETDANPFSSATTPTHLSEVVCDPPNCPFTEEGLQHFLQQLNHNVDRSSRDMNIRRLVWQQALTLCERIYDQYNM